MLDIKICAKCCAEAPDGLEFNKTPLAWSGRWFTCPESLVDVCNNNISNADAYKPPPEWCPYALEHILKEAADVTA